MALRMAAMVAQLKGGAMAPLEQRAMVQALVYHQPTCAPSATASSR
ncbi:MAG TPA: hypothetical protein IGP91_04710 [Thermosynechococcus sp. M46_R2017_013]|nr:hypothetical protein [Thermosynechococcus sp. M46_R2017_013]